MNEKKSNAPYIVFAVLIFAVLIAFTSNFKTAKEKEQIEDKVQQQELLLEEIEEAKFCKNLRAETGRPSGMIWDGTGDAGRCYVWDVENENWRPYEHKDWMPTESPSNAETN